VFKHFRQQGMRKPCHEALQSFNPRARKGRDISQGHRTFTRTEMSTQRSRE